MGTILHIGETSIDFLEVADLWPEELGSFYERQGAQARVADALSVFKAPGQGRRRIPGQGTFDALPIPHHAKNCY